MFLWIHYLLGTTLGHANIGKILEKYISKKTNNKVVVNSLNLEHYPNIKAELKINNTSYLSLKGNSDSDDLNMTYHLRGESFTWNHYNVTEAINIKGEIFGKTSEAFVKGEGELFKGKTVYSFIKKPNYFENINIMLNDIESKSLLKFLKYEPFLKGKMDAFIEFENFTLYRKKGFAKISLAQAYAPKVLAHVPFSLNSEIVFKDLFYEYFADIHSDVGKIRVANGYYNKAAGFIKADYGVHINELSYFEELLKRKYYGELNLAGSMKYESGDLSFVGDSTSYEGLLSYEYKHHYLDLNFEAVSLEKFLRQLSFPPLLSSKVYGSASYDIKDEIILINTELKETKFRRTKMTDTLFDVTGIDVLKDTYDESIFTAGYQNSVLTSLLQIDNGVNHLYLRDTRMNSKTNKVTADFEVKIEGQEFIGEVYGTLENPKINLDISKLIKYQINKKIENFFGIGKPLKDENPIEQLNQSPEIKPDVIKQQTRSYLEGFFN